MSTIDYRDKIAKLLAKAESTDNPHEAEAFSQTAERLMLKWGIEEAEIRAAMGDGRPSLKIVKETLAFRGTYALGNAYLAFYVTRGLGNIQAIKSKAKGGVDMHIVGTEGDVLRAIMLTTSLQVQCEAARRAWWKREGHQHFWMAASDKTKAQREFILSFGLAVMARLEAARTEEVSERGTGTELVLADVGAAVKEAFDEMFTKQRKGRSLRRSVVGGAAGRQAGERANLGAGAIGGSRATIGAR